MVRAVVHGVGVGVMVHGRAAHARRKRPHPNPLPGGEGTSRLSAPAKACPERCRRVGSRQCRRAQNVLIENNILTVSSTGRGVTLCSPQVGVCARTGEGRSRGSPLQPPERGRPWMRKGSQVCSRQRSVDEARMCSLRTTFSRLVAQVGANVVFAPGGGVRLNRGRAITRIAPTTARTGQALEAERVGSVLATTVFSRLAVQGGRCCVRGRFDSAPDWR
jgi:hypothetical protein